MALTRMDKGQEVAISAEEEAAIMAERAVEQGKKDLEIIQLVKAEARRRILKIIPEWKQQNLNARANELNDKQRPNWTSEELAEWDAGMALWAKAKAIRVASDAIEAMTPVPENFNDDTYWPKE